MKLRIILEIGAMIVLLSVLAARENSSYEESPSESNARLNAQILMTNSELCTVAKRLHDTRGFDMSTMKCRFNRATHQFE